MKRFFLAILLLLPGLALAQPVQAPGFARSKNLSDLPNAATARSNLGLGTLSTQNAAAAAITGGTVDGAVIGGTTPAAGTFAPLTINGTMALNYTATTPAQYGEVNANGSMNWPIGAAGGCCRTHYWSDTVTVTGNQAGVNVLEQNFYNLILAGSGTLTNEAFNQVHPYAYIPSGVTLSGYAESFESSALNDGAVTGFNGSLNIYTNGAGTTGTYSAYKTSATNNNATAASFANYTGFECAGFNGSGSVPTFRWCLVNRDAAASIVTLGGVVIGQLASATAAGTLSIKGPDTVSGTFPFFIKNSASTNIFGVTDAGGATLYLGDFTVNSGAVNATTFKASGTIGVSCGAGTVSLATLVVSSGIVTHC